MSTINKIIGEYNYFFDTNWRHRTIGQIAKYFDITKRKVLSLMIKKIRSSRRTLINKYNSLYNTQLTYTKLRRLAKKRRVKIYTVYDILKDKLDNKLNVVKQTIDNINDVSIVKRMIRDNGLKGNIRVLWYVDGELEQQSYYNVTDPLKKWWDIEGVDDWLFGASGLAQAVFSQYPDAEQEIIIMKPTRLSAKKIYQYFAEGELHCVLTPILIWAQDKLDNSISRAGRRYKTLIKKINKYIKIYEKGISENDLKKVCDDLRVDINIKDIFGNVYLNVRCSCKRIKVFNYINTRPNHIDNLVSLDNIIEVESIDEIKKDLCGEYMIYNNYELCTLDTHYVVKDKMMEVLDKFEVESGLDKIKIDGVKDKNLSEFIKAGNHISGCVDFNNCNIDEYDDLFGGVMKMIKRSFEPDHHIDQTTAYTQFKACGLYQGFPSKITDFRKVKCIDKRKFLLEHIGYYKISNITRNIDDNVTNVLKKLNIYNIDCVLPSVECLFLLDIGFDFKIEFGCWSAKSFDFEFPEYMKDKNNMDTRLYSIWSGMRSRINGKKKWGFKCNVDMANHLKSIYDEVSYWEGECNVEFNKTYHTHLAQITGFIYSYARISLLKQLFEIECADIVRVVMDGIYYRGDITVHPTFRHKPIEMGLGGSGNCFYNTHKYNGEVDIEYRINNQYEANIGAGGSGKTHHNLTDNGFVNSLFVAPSWKLTRSKIKEYNCSGTVKARLLGQGCRYNYNPSVIIVDEATMWTEKEKELVMSLYPYSKIVFCGDFSPEGLIYQLPPVGGIGMKLNMPIKIFETNYRCKCDKLKKILGKLRLMIEWKWGKQSIKKELDRMMINAKRLIISTDVEKQYGINDYILCSRRTCKLCKKTSCECEESNNYVGEWTKAFMGKFDKEKYLITRNTKMNSNGDIVISAKNVAGAEIRHAFTIHAIQGETCKTKLFIDSRNLFDPRMAYTALSRAERLSDIYYVWY